MIPVKQPQRLFTRMKKAVLREDMMALTQDVTQALVLGQMLYWTKTLDKVNDWLFEENKRLAEVELPQHEYNYGWIYKSAREMREDLMNAFSEDAIQRAFSALVTKGVLMKRNNPIVRYDRKLQYRIDMVYLRRLLKDRGYEMTDFQLATIPQEAAFIPQGAVCITQGAETITEINTKIKNKENLLTSLKEEEESSAVASRSSDESTDLFPTEITANAKASFATAQRNDPPKNANAITADFQKNPPQIINQNIMITFQQRANRLLGRRDTTKWTPKEIRASKSNLDTCEEDWKLLENFYSKRNEKDVYTRRSMETLLNNWAGEIDKARAHKEREEEKGF